MKAFVRDQSTCSNQSPDVSCPSFSTRYPWSRSQVFRFTQRRKSVNPWSLMTINSVSGSSPIFARSSPTNASIRA